ncbi:somatostatin receptor type 5-like [Branchiostoma floridae x Branchiostoma belcheri]
MEGHSYNPLTANDNKTEEIFDSFFENQLNQTNSTNQTIPVCEELVLQNLMPYYVIFSLLAFAGIVGNALIILVLRKHEKARTTAEIYVLNMATTDMLMLSMVPVLVTRNIMNLKWIFGDFLCRVYYLIAGLNMFNTVFILTAMSVDRYFCVSRPLRSLDWKTTRTAKIVCALLWVISTVIDLPWVIWADIGSPIPYCDTPMCLYDFPAYHGDDHFWERLSEIGVLFLSFVVPIILITGTHIGILWHIRNAAASLDRTQRSQEKVTKIFFLNSFIQYTRNHTNKSYTVYIINRDKVREDKITSGTSQLRLGPAVFCFSTTKVTKMVFAIVVVFVICWLPKNVAYLAQRFDWFVAPNELHIGFEMLLITNSAINPYLYTIFGQHFQRRLMGIFFPARHRRSMVTRTTVVMRCKNETPPRDRRRHDSAPNHWSLDVEAQVEKTDDRSLSTSEKEAETCSQIQVEDTEV